MMIRQQLYYVILLAGSEKDSESGIYLFYNEPSASNEENNEKEEEEVILGCIDTKAVNYNSKATIDDESCKYAPIANADVGELNRLSTTEGPETCEVWKCFTAGSTIQFNGTATDEDGFIVLYEWDFDGDGVYEWSSSDNGQTTKIYNSVNLYKAVLKVTDNDGFTDTDSIILLIAPADEDESLLPSVSMIPALISIGLVAIYCRKPKLLN